MKCPVCKTVNLVMADKQGVEIDYCPECRGVWLDRGELDKIIERSAAYDSAPTSPVAQPQPSTPKVKKKSHQQGHKKQKKNRMTDLLGDIFDF